MKINQISGRLNMRIPFKRWSVYLIVVFSCLGFLLAVTQILGQSPDYSSYDDFLNLVRSEGLDTLAVSRFEPGFSLFSFFLTTLFATNVVVYSWIVVAAMLLKGWAIHAYSSSQKIFIVVAAFYLVRYLPLHELTQLRAACAIGFLMVAATLLWNGNRLYGLLACVTALLFHMSAAAIIPALFLPPPKRWQVIFIAIVTFVLTFMFSSFLTDYLANFIQIIESYETQGFGELEPNPFAIQLLIDWAMIAVSLVMWNRLSLLMRRIIILELLGMAIFYGAIEFPSIAHRIREFYSVFWVFFVADGLRQKATRLVTYGFILVSIIFYSYVFVFSGTFYH